MTETCELGERCALATASRKLRREGTPPTVGICWCGNFVTESRILHPNAIGEFPCHVFRRESTTPAPPVTRFDDGEKEGTK
jgi:hypothetical protein